MPRFTGLFIRYLLLFVAFGISVSTAIAQTGASGTLQ